MFERMEIYESIYKGVVEHSDRKSTRVYANRSGHSKKNIIKATSSWTHTEKSVSAGNRKIRHVDSPTRKSKTYLIHGPRNYSE